MSDYNGCVVVQGYDVTAGTARAIGKPSTDDAVIVQVSQTREQICYASCSILLGKDDPQQKIFMTVTRMHYLFCLIQVDTTGATNILSLILHYVVGNTKFYSWES